MRMTTEEAFVKVLQMHGIAHAFGGRADEAVACIDHAVRLSPREVFLGDYDLFYAFAHFQAARYELGLRHAREAHRWRPGHPTPLLMGAACAGHLADAEAAAGLLHELRALVPGASMASIEAFRDRICGASGETKRRSVSCCWRSSSRR